VNVPETRGIGLRTTKHNNCVAGVISKRLLPGLTFGRDAGHEEFRIELGKPDTGDVHSRLHSTRKVRTASSILSLEAHGFRRRNCGSFVRLPQVLATKFGVKTYYQRGRKRIASRGG